MIKKIIKIEDVYPDKNTNEFLIQMFKLILFRRLNKLEFLRVRDRKKDKKYVACLKHHIIPRCYFKHNNLPIDNSEDNIIVLTFSEHVEVHCLLRDYFKSIGNFYMYYAMAYAILKICNSGFKLIGVLGNDDITKKELLNKLQENYEKVLESKSLFLKNSLTYINIKTKEVKHFYKDKTIPNNFIEYNSYLKDKTYLIYEIYKTFPSKEEFEKLFDKIKTLLDIILITIKNIDYYFRKFITNFKSLPKTIREKRSYTNGKKNIYLCDGDKIPDNFYLGYSPSKKYSQIHRISILKCKGSCKDMIWINNPKTKKQTLIKKDNKIPDGWIIGRITKANLKWSNDEVLEIFKLFKTYGYTIQLKEKYNLKLDIYLLVSFLSRRLPKLMKKFINEIKNKLKCHNISWRKFDHTKDYKY